jgi:hypothetical protein
MPDKKAPANREARTKREMPEQETPERVGQQTNAEPSASRGSAESARDTGPGTPFRTRENQQG